MEEPFYRERLEAKFALEVLAPPLDERSEVHRIIYEELSYDRVPEPSWEAVLSAVAGLAACGAEAVVLGCTELPVLFRGHAESGAGGNAGAGAAAARGQPEVAVPLLDPVYLHCREAVRLAAE